MMDTKISLHKITIDPNISSTTKIYKRS